MSNQMIQFDVTKRSPNQTVIVGRQGDSALKMVTANLWDGVQGVPLDLTNKQLTLEIKKPDDSVYIDNGNFIYLNAKQGQFRYTFNEQAFAAAGNAKQAFFKITHIDDNGNMITDSTLDFDIDIKPNLVEFGINSEPFIGDYDKLVKAVEQKFKDYADTVAGDEKKVADIHDDINALIKQINDNKLLTIKDTQIVTDDVAFINLKDFDQSSVPIAYQPISSVNVEPDKESMGYIEANTDYLQIMTVKEL